jgi:ABC-type polysaccharide/polyol phosphate transport system ATPase subunit
MNEENIAVSIRHLNKIYKVFDSPLQRMRSLLFKSKVGRDFTALDDINVDIAKGEAFAIVGKNGSGKSTMLQILAGIIKPTSGEVKVNGRIAALLELGSGFDPESTGYENIYMNAAILGLTQNRIEERINDIIEFADIGQHLYEPVKTYSSGMYVRLGFAVAINVDAEILLVDEALAVGDIFFRQKCYSRLNELKKNGTTIILVTHNMGEVEQFCDRAMLLNQSKMIDIGDSRDVVKKYYMIDTFKEDITAEDNSVRASKAMEKCYTLRSGGEISSKDLMDLGESKQVTNGKARVVQAGLFGEDGKTRVTFEQGEWAFFFCVIEVIEDIDIPNVGIIIRNQMGILVHGKDALQTDVELPDKVDKGQRLYFQQHIQMNLENGEYTFGIGVGSIREENYKMRKSFSQEELDAKIEHVCDANDIGSFVVTIKKIGNPTRMGFYGISNLPGKMEIELGDN